MPIKYTEREHVAKKCAVRLFAIVAILSLSIEFASAHGSHSFGGRPLLISDAPNASMYLDPVTQATTPSEPKETSREKENRVFNESSIDLLEKHLFELINKEREKAGLSKLQFDSQLSAFARKHADDMLTNNFFAHVDSKGIGPQKRAIQNGITRPLYENIGWQSGTDSPTRKVDDIENSFMTEPLGEHNHRYIILLPEHACVGIGIARNNDELYLVHEFADTLSDVIKPK